MKLKIVLIHSTPVENLGTFKYDKKPAISSHDLQMNEQNEREPV